jgi:hypothetical protein
MGYNHRNLARRLKTGRTILIVKANIVEQQASGKLGEVSMPVRRTSFLADQYYHIYNRGISGNPIFFFSDNYVYLLNLLGRNLRRYKIAVVALCLAQPLPYCAKT